MIDPDRQQDVLIAYVHNGSVANCFMDSVIAAYSEDLRRNSAGSTPRIGHYYSAQGPYIHDNRSRVARYFLECTDLQWLWFLDNDMDFPVDSIYHLLTAAEQHDARILGAAYWNQYYGTARYLSWLVFTPDGIKAVPEIPDTPEPVEVSAVGMGCTLIHRDVLQDVADMYANDPWDTFAADQLVRFANGRMLIGRNPEDLQEQDPDIFKNSDVVDNQRMGEDVTFCLRARKAGYLSYGLPSLVAEHFKTSFLPHGRSEQVPVRG